MEIKRDDYLEEIKAVMHNGLVKVITGGYERPWADENGILHAGVIPFLLDKSIIEA